MFMTDERRIFRVDKGAWVPAFCNLTSSTSIADITSVCDGSGKCTPVILQIVDGQFSSITDCRTGRSGPLLQEAELADHITVRQVSGSGDLFEQRLIVTQKGKLMQYMWSQSRSAWMP